MLSASVHAEEERVRAGQQVSEILETLRFAGGDHLEGDKSGRFIRRLAAVFLQPLLLVEALGLGAGQKRLARFGAPGPQIDALNQPLFDRLLERDLVMRPTHRIALLDNAADDLVKDTVSPAMGRDDFKLPAPGDDRLGDAIKQALVLVQREFVEHNMAAF